MVEPAPADSGGYPSSSRDESVTLIVQMQGPAVLSSLRGSIAGPHGRWRTRLESTPGRAHRRRVDQEQHAFAQELRRSVPDARITSNMRLALNAVAVTVPSANAAAIAELPGVRAVWADTPRHLQTTRGPALVGATAAWAGVGGNVTTGDNVVIGFIDSGIWPEHPSFADPGTEGAYHPPPDWTATACEFGGTPGDAAFACNNKIVGARRVMSSYDQQHTLQPGEFASARDDGGHGTAVATVAAANRNVAGQIRGNPVGTTAGVAPHARLAVYKVCGRSGCYNSDAVAAIEQAIADGVDVISLPFTGGADPYNDPLSLALLEAHEAGVFVAVPAGNSGFGSVTGRREPWTTVVGATRLDRVFISALTLRAGTITTTVYGTSVTTGISSPTPLINAAAMGDANCVASAPANSFAGAIVICARGGNARLEKSRNVQLRGGIGMILTNPSPADLSADNHSVPTIHLDKAGADTLAAFLSTHAGGARASFSAGTSAAIPGESLSPFTSRGGAGQPLSVTKPDLVAPGQYVITGHSPAAVIPANPPGEFFQMLDGTSIAAAHVVGAAALLKSQYPSWSPDHIRSALMLTATTTIANEAGRAASQFDMGAGRINVAAALAPGFAILPAPNEFLNKRSRLWDVNYPSLYAARLPGVMTTQRVLTNLENRQATWAIQIAASAGVRISAPTSVTLPPLGSASVLIAVDASSVPADFIASGSLTFTEVAGTRRLRVPIVALYRPDAMPVTATCAPATFRVGQTTDCSITVSNLLTEATTVTVFDTLPAGLRLVPDSVVNASASDNTVLHHTTLAAAAPATIDFRVFPPWAGFDSLSGRFAPIACSGSCDDRVFTANVPAGILFNGTVHTTITISTNGFIQFGAGGPAAPLNQSLPDAAAPNGVLAPFWTDLHPAGTDGQGAGHLYAGYYSIPSGRSYLAVEWNGVAAKGSTARHTFQVWLQVGGQVEDVTFSYETLESLGAGGALTVGAESPDGTDGRTYYVNAGGTPPRAQTNLFVSSPAPSAGGSHTIGFRARGHTSGTFTHCAIVARNGFTEFATSCVPVVVQP